MTTSKYFVTLIERHDRPSGETVARMHLRDSNNTAQMVDIVGHEPHFFGLKENYEEQKDTIKYMPEVSNIDENPGLTSVYDEELVKVSTKNSGDIPEVRDVFDYHFGGDCYYHHRVRIDLGITTGVEIPNVAILDGEVHADDVEAVDYTEPDYRVMNLDIEVSDANGFPDVDEADSRILSLVAHDSYTDQYVVWVLMGDRKLDDVWEGELPEYADNIRPFYGEKGMLQDFIDFVGEIDVDILTGWNFEGFDMPYIIGRAKNLNCDLSGLARYGNGQDVYVNNGRSNVPGRQPVDMLSAYKQTKFTEQDSYTLDNTGKRELGVEKVQFDGKYHELWERDLEKFVRYNCRDVELTVTLDRELDIFGFMLGLQKDIGCEFNDTMYPKDMIPFAVRRMCHDYGKVPPSKSGKQRPYEGAYVFEPYNGVANNVIAIDLASLYPNNFVMGNLSPETKVDMETATQLREQGIAVTDGQNGTFYRQDKTGIMADMCDKYLSLKRDLKQRLKEMSPNDPEHEQLQERYNVTKSVVNSTYGVVGWKWFFWYDPDTAEACTALGQKAIKRTRDWIDGNTDGHTIYGDSDSCYIEFPDDMNAEVVQRKAFEICESLNNEVYPALAEECGIPPENNRWEIEPEAYISRYFQAGKKKRYAYIEAAEPNEKQEWEWNEDTSPSIKGFQYKRSDTAPVSDDVQRSVIKEVMGDFDKATIRKYIHEAAMEVAATNDWDRVGIPSGMGKDVPMSPDDVNDDTYGWSTNLNGPSSATARGVYNAHKLGILNVRQVSKAKRVVLDPGRSNGLDVIAFENADQLGNHRNNMVMDREAMVNKVVTKPMKGICDSIDIDVEASLDGHEQTGLDNFV